MVLRYSQPLHLSLLCLLLCSPCQISESRPHYLVTSGKGKCVTVIAPEGTNLIVEYEAPDIVFNKTETTYAPTWISIHALPSKLTAKDYMNPHEWKKPFQDAHANNNLKATSVELEKHDGWIEWMTPKSGEVQVCIRASGANTQNPMRFGLFIEKEDEVHAHEALSKTVSGVTDHHLTHMEVEMRHLMVSMKNILAEADFSKDREIAFHEKTLSMHAASMWWPIVQLSVLLLTGFTQVNHMVRFFQSRRIF